MRQKKLLIAIFTLAMGSTGAFAGDDHDGGGRGDHGGGGYSYSQDYPDYRRFFRMDCRFHNTESHTGASFCYASAVYKAEHGRVSNLHLGVGCDNQTFFNDKARVQVETTLDRISPLRAATPAVEVFPQGQLNIEGTYTSVLDLHLGRFQGLCYVHKISTGRDDHHRRGDHDDHGDRGDQHDGGQHDGGDQHDGGQHDDPYDRGGDDESDGRW